MFKESFIANIKRARISAEMTQEQVAEKLSISRTNITKYEQGIILLY